MSKLIDNTEEKLEDFAGWENTPTENDFFNEEAVVKEEKKEESTDKKEVLDKNKEVNFFEKKEDVKDDFYTEGEEEEEVEEEEKEGVKGKSKPKDITSNTLLDSLSKRGIINYEAEEDLSEEEAEDLLEDKFEESVENKLKDLINNVPDSGKQIINFVLKGGDLEEFFNTVSKNSNASITADIDLNKEENQELVAREMLKEEGFDKDYIDTQLDFLKDSEKLKMFSEKRFNKWKKRNDKEQSALLERQEQMLQSQKESLRRAKSNTLEFISENDGVGNLKFNRSDKKYLPSYMNDRAVKLQNGSSISQMQKELFYDLPQNEEAFMQLAMLMKNRNRDGTFNFESIKQNAETRVVKKLKNDVRRSKSNTPTKSITIKDNGLEKSLADYFD